jgi:hypothetical protein
VDALALEVPEAVDEECFAEVLMDDDLVCEPVLLELELELLLVTVERVTFADELSDDELEDEDEDEADEVVEELAVLEALEAEDVEDAMDDETVLVPSMTNCGVKLMLFLFVSSMISKA